jgi:L-amino acid N-acyltransferase YncA
MHIRPAESRDEDAVWRIMEPVIRAGETFALPRAMSRDDAFAYWYSADRGVWIAEEATEVVGTYCIRAIRPAGGSHVANCGYMVGTWAARRGVGRAMCEDSIARARAMGFKAMQYNFVISTNEHAIRLYQSLGFEIAGRLPGAFAHPTQGYVDAYVMFLRL